VVFVAYPGDPGTEDFYPRQNPSQRDDDVARFQAPNRCLGKERLVGHEVARGHEQQVGLASEQALKPARAEQADEPAAHDYDAWCCPPHPLSLAGR
jgi:hypothetical protein